MSGTINFTINNISRLPLPPKGKRFYFRDAVQRGLILDVRSNGSKSYYVYKKIKSRPEKIFICAYPDLTIEQVRKKAASIIGQIAEGKNPQNDKRRVRDEMTFGKLFEEYMNRYSKVHKKSWLSDEREINRFLSQWFGRKLSDIKKTDVQHLHEKMFKENGLIRANRILQRVNALFNKGIEWGWEGKNPASGIKKYKEPAGRDRFIQPSEMPYFIQAINQEKSSVTKDLFWILLLTGVRKTNALMMRWDEMNFERNEWRIPETKNGEPVFVALVTRAIEILKSRQKVSNSPWVFPQDNDNSKYYRDPLKAWRRIIRRATYYIWQSDEKLNPWIELIEKQLREQVADEDRHDIICINAKKEKKELPVGIMDVTIHDIRRTFASFQALSGSSLQIIGKSLGHKSMDSTKIYARLNFDPVRTSVEKATSMILHHELSTTDAP